MLSLRTEKSLISIIRTRCDLIKEIYFFVPFGAILLTCVFNLNKLNLMALFTNVDSINRHCPATFSNRFLPNYQLFVFKFKK